MQEPAPECTRKWCSLRAVRSLGVRLAVAALLFIAVRFTAPAWAADAHDQSSPPTSGSLITSDGPPPDPLVWWPNDGSLIISDGPPLSVLAWWANDGVHFNWPAVQACASQPTPLNAPEDERMIMNCRMWLQARHAGWIATGTGIDDPMPHVPMINDNH